MILDNRYGQDSANDKPVFYKPSFLMGSVETFGIFPDIYCGEYIQPGDNAYDMGATICTEFQEMGPKQRLRALSQLYKVDQGDRLNKLAPIVSDISNNGQEADVKKLVKKLFQNKSEINRPVAYVYDDHIHFIFDLSDFQTLAGDKAGRSSEKLIESPNLLRRGATHLVYKISASSMNHNNPLQENLMRTDATHGRYKGLTSYFPNDMQNADLYNELIAQIHAGDGQVPDKVLQDLHRSSAYENFRLMNLTVSDPDMIYMGMHGTIDRISANLSTFMNVTGGTSHPRLQEADIFSGTEKMVSDGIEAVQRAYRDGETHEKVRFAMENLTFGEFPERFPEMIKAMKKSDFLT